tara:strand:- start:166 stop:702 length:537 start_codon:yes stop_codon:yes gene_type:complete
MSSEEYRTKLISIQTDVVRLLDTLAHQHLCNPETLMLHEVMLYNHRKPLEAAFGPRPRAEILGALMDPSKYLQADNINEDDTIQSEMPDECIMYKLLKERAINVNLYDWFESFCAIIAANKTTTKRTRNNAKSVNAMMKEPSVQARFIRSMADLQFVGTFAPKNRKQDHVTRLVYGNN